MFESRFVVYNGSHVLRSQDAVRAKLRSKLKNFRFRDASSSKENEAKRPKTDRSAEVGLPHYHAESAVDGWEVQAAFRLKNGLDSLPPEEVKDLKTKTFPMRRKLLIRAKDCLSDVKLRFPWLFDELEVSVVIYCH